jgi:hypothetical protein
MLKQKKSASVLLVIGCSSQLTIKEGLIVHGIFERKVRHDDFETRHFCLTGLLGKYGRFEYLEVQEGIRLL